MTRAEIEPLLTRLRGESSPYLTRGEADELLPWLASASASNDPWAMWIAGRVADSNLLPRDRPRALDLWERGHALGHAGCTFELARRLERATPLDPRQDASAKLYESAAAAGSGAAAIRRGRLAMRRGSSEAWRIGWAGASVHVDEAVRWFRRAIELGREDAAFDLALAIRSRHDAGDEAVAESSRQRALAAEAGPADLLARVLESDGADDGTPSLDPLELPPLVAWLTRASTAGDAWASWLYGRLADSGQAPGGATLATTSWQRGLELGDARCAFELGLRVEKKKKKEASVLYEKAAAGGLGLAALRLGHLAPKWTDAERWYRRAIERGRGDAWLDLARLLTSGAKGAPIDLAEAARCWERAAEAGGEGPLALVTEMFDEGAFVGLPLGRDPSKAYRFAAQGLDLGRGGGVPRCQFVMAKLLFRGEAPTSGADDREDAAILCRLAARRADHASEPARLLHGEIWATLDAGARQRVEDRDRELHYGVEQVAP